MNDPQTYYLTVTTYDEELKAYRATIQPDSVKFVLGSDCEIKGKPLKKALLFFIDDKEPFDLYVDEIDLHHIEKAVGNYIL